MLKKLFIIIFVVFAYFTYGVAFTYSRVIDSDRILAWYEQPGFQVNMLELPVDLGGKGEAILRKLVDLSEAYSVNVFVKPHVLDKEDNLYIYAYLQQDEYLSRLPVQGLGVHTHQEFNQSVGKVFANTKGEDVIGRLLTTSNHLNYRVASLLSLGSGELPTCIFLTHKEGQTINRFINEFRFYFRELDMTVKGHQEYVQQYYRVDRGGLFARLFSFFQYLGVDIAIAVIFLFLTTVIYLFNRQRTILIEKLHGVASHRIFFKYLLPLVLPALALSLLLAVPYQLLYGGLMNVRTVAVFGTYLIGLILMLAVFTVFSSAAMFYIMRLQPIELIKRKQSNHILIGIGYTVKAITVPLIIISLAASATALSDTFRTRGRLVNYKTTYENYVRLAGGNPAEYILDENSDSYIARVYKALDAENMAVYLSSLTIQEFPLAIPIRRTNQTLVDKYRLVDAEGKDISFETGRRYCLVPQGRFTALIEALRHQPQHIGLFLGSADVDPWNLTGDVLEELLQEVENSIVVIKDNQQIPHFRIEGFETVDGMMDEYILFVEPDYRPYNARDIFIDTQGRDDYQIRVEEALAKQGLPMVLGYTSATEIADQALAQNQSDLLRSFQESVVYLVLLIYISYLTIFFSFKSRQHEVAVKTFHGHPIFPQFRALFIYGLILDGALFLYLVARGSYLWYHVMARGTKEAFAALLIIDSVILVLSIMSFRGRAIQNVLKRIE